MIRKAQIAGLGLATALFLAQAQTAFAVTITPLQTNGPQNTTNTTQNTGSTQGTNGVQGSENGPTDPGTDVQSPIDPTGTTNQTQNGTSTTDSGLTISGTYNTTDTQTPEGWTQEKADAAAKLTAPSVSAEAAVLYDVTNGRMLYEKNADEKLYPASITKLMTALVVLEHAKLDDTVTFSKTAVTNLESGAVTLNLTEGDKLTVKDCLYGLLLKSANDVANGLAESVGGSISGFADMMNAKAAELGCTGTHFVNPNGLNDSNHYSTCRDMEKIAEAAFANDTIKQICSTMSYQFPATKKAAARTLTPGHKMLYSSDARYYPGIIGGKTGYTSRAGNTLVTAVEKDGVRLIAVVMKASSTHYADTKSMLDYGYAFEAIGLPGTPGQTQFKNRWVQSGSDWYFELADGTRLKNCAAVINGAEYVFDADGTMATGWRSVNGTWYYFETSGALARNAWKQDAGKWFYVGPNGQMVKNALIDNQYYVGADGVWVQQ